MFGSNINNPFPASIPAIACFISASIPHLDCIFLDIMIMAGGRSLGLFHVIVILLLHLKPALAFSTHDIGCIERERQALLVFKQGLVDEFGILSSWGSEDNNKNCCQWRGIQCSKRTGHVLKLDLANDGYGPLRGKISHSLIELHHLNYLDLSVNDFNESKIPKFIGSLNNLEYLNLTTANLSGSIPYQLGNLSHLKSLDLSFNDFIESEIPEFISSLSNLKYLNLISVNLIGPIPYQLGNLSHLKSLDLTHNDFNESQMPEFISSLSNLKVLNLVSANLSGPIPYQLGNLSHLESLDLSRNDFNESQIPEFISSLSNLKYLNLASANFGGPIPYQLGNLSHLESLDLGSNYMTYVENLEWLSHLSSLKRLDLSSANLSKAHNWLEAVNHLSVLSTLLLRGCDLPPTNFSVLPHDKSSSSLNIVYLSSNHLTTSIFQWLFNYMNSLEILDLSDNQLEGSIPKSIGNMCNLRRLYMSSNNLSGNVPKSFGNLYNLEVLEVFSNSLKGVIYEGHLSNLSKLWSLDLSHNSLALKFNIDWVPPFQLDELYLRSCKSGPNFPNWFRTQMKLYSLDLSNNEILDTIPEWFWDLSLNFANLSNNQITGSLPRISLKPSDLSSNRLEGPLPLFSPYMSTLYLSKNWFSGSISSICKITGGYLEYLDLSDNLLYGELPNCFSHWPQLAVLNLANNNLSGKIPTSLGLLYALQTLNLRNNSFSGDLPSSMKNCNSLKLMELGDNKFSGKLPTWIGEGLSGLLVLILRSNKFFGSLPLQLCHLSYLRILDLSLNDISGTIPSCFNNFSFMAGKGDSSYIFDEINVTGSSLNYWDGNYLDIVKVVLKGREFEYGKNLGLLRIIDLSSNKLIGKLPNEILSLSELVALNISRNNLTGDIPSMIGQLKQLESLDLSRNKFSGEIPSTMSDLHFLSHMDLSYNNLYGKIPSGTQIQGFDASMFAGNDALCGPPLTNKCPGEETSNPSEPINGVGRDNEEDGDEFTKWFYAGMGLGFGASFWGVCGTLLLKRSWRHAYFIFLDNMKEWLLVTMAVNKARLKMKFQRHG